MHFLVKTALRCFDFAEQIIVKFRFFGFLLMCMQLNACVHSYTLYEQLGERPGITNIVQDTIEKVHQEPKVKTLFRDTDDQEFANALFDQICDLADGPCDYDGLDMNEAHAGMEITAAEFDVFVELFIEVLNENNISFVAQNRLLAFFAAMRSDIIGQ